MKTIDLGSGLCMHYINTRKFKTAVICILIRSKLTREDATLTAVIPSVLQNGSQKYKTIAEINTAMEDLFGAVFEIQVIKKAEEQIIQFYIEFVCGEGEFAGNADFALEFLYETLLFPLVEDGGFSKEYTESGKQSLKNMILGRINNKKEYAKLKCIQQMCADEAFGIYADGYLEDLPELDGKKIYTHYMKLLKSSQIDFIFAGSIDVDFCFEKVKKLFVNKLLSLGRISAYEGTLASEAGIACLSHKEKIISESMDISQGKVCMGFRAGVKPVSKEFFALLLFNELLGGSANSRLFLNIREKQNLCYYISSQVYRYKSIVLVQSGVDSSNAAMLIREVKRHIEDLSKPGEITDEEFEYAKKSLEMKYRSIPDNQNMIIEFHLSQYLMCDETDLDTVIAGINTVHKSAVEKIAAQIKLDTVFKLEAAVKE